MATRFYLPSTGTAPLGSLAVDSQWELSDNLERRPCDVIKSNSSLTQKSATWTSTTTQQWVWVQFQSKRLAEGYSWTTADAVSMVIKVAESAAQVDSHLCYVIRVVSGDGSTIRGTVGSYLTTSSEYPTSLASIATRIHDARTTGASNFSSQAGDRIIIEIGHHGVSPTLGTVYHNYGDPTATQDFSLAAGDTNDYVPWVELTRDLNFVLTDSQSAYTKGTSTATATPQHGYTEGTPATTPASDTQNAYTKGRTDATPDNQSAFVKGKLDATPDSQSAYTRGGTSALDSQNAYTKGRTAATPDSQNAYTKGKIIATPSSKSSYLKGSVAVLDNQNAYIKGKTDATPDNQPAFVRGKTDATPDNQSVYTRGIIGILDSQNSYTKGRTNATPDSQNAYTKGSMGILDSQNAYIKGISTLQLDNQNAYSRGISILQLDNQNVYLKGILSASGIKSGYTEGYTASGTNVTASKSAYIVSYPLDFKHAFILGLDNGLVPDGDVSSSGIWLNENNSSNNLYQSIDEYPTANDNDYIWNTNPVDGDYYECSLSNPSGTPGSGDVVVYWRGRDKSGLGMQHAKVELRQGTTIIASKEELLTSTPTTYYFQLTTEEKALITDWNDLRVRIMPTTSMKMMAMAQGDALWQQANSQTYIDNMLSELEGYATDIAVLCYYAAGSNRPVLGESTLCYETTVSINGKKPLTYLCEQAAAVGIKVWAWFVFMYSSNWCGTTGILLDSIPDTTDYRTPGYIILYGVESSRTKIANAMVDFMEQNSGLAGMMLDYIRTDGVVEQNASDITSLVQEISNGVPAGMQLGFFSLANTSVFTSLKQDGKTWVDNGYIDFLVTMNYNSAWFDKWDYIRDLAAVPIYIGLSSAECENSASGYRARMSAYRQRGHNKFADFQWISGGMYDAPNNFLDAITDYKNYVTPIMDNVTSISCNWVSGGSLSFTIGGVTRTINYNDVADHTTDSALKDHIEELYGELPWLWFLNETAQGYLYVEYGDRSEYLR